MGTRANSEGPGEMSQDLHCFVRQNRSSELGKQNGGGIYSL